MMGGGRIQTIGGERGKIDPALLAGHLKRFDPPFLHHGRAVALTLTQSTESGTVYSLDEITALSNEARRFDLAVHMDGARFANALVHLDASPAAMCQQAGIDMVSFGGTKNGCWCAEALLVFDPALRETAEYLRKRSGHLFSKARFVSLQFLAYFKDDLWLELARHANSMANRLRSGISGSARARLEVEKRGQRDLLRDRSRYGFAASRARRHLLRLASAAVDGKPAWRRRSAVSRGDKFRHAVRRNRPVRRDHRLTCGIRSFHLRLTFVLCGLTVS